MVGSTHFEPGVPTREISLLRLGADIILIILCGVPSLCLLLFVTPHQRGYFCNDESLNYPYVEEAIPTASMAFIGSSIAISVITYCEVMRVVFWESPNRDSPVPYRVIAYYIGHRSVHRIFIRLYKYIGYFILGAAFGMMFVDISKYSSGRLRPHFFNVCQPIPIDAANCSIIDINRFVDHYECTASQSAHRLKDVHLSFYSGHSSFAFYTAMYLVLYLQARVRPCGIFLSSVLLPILQFIFFALAMFSAILNVTQNMHHWSDVFCGIVMGNLIAVIMCIYVLKLFHYKKVVHKISHQLEV